MKKGSSVTKKQLDLAVVEIQEELYRAGFWNEGCRLTRTEVYWCRFPQIVAPDALGFFFHGTDRFQSLLGYETGHMYIPKWVLIHGPWQQRGSLRDVVRHEYGHALAHYYPWLIQQGSRFREAFGGKYLERYFSSYWESEHVSRYATSRPAEDFSETFMFYLRSGGRLPERFFHSYDQKKVEVHPRSGASGRIWWKALVKKPLSMAGG